MITITLNNIDNLNISLQIGDIVYATPTTTQAGSSDAENSGLPVGETYLVGKLVNINDVGGGAFNLIIDQTDYPNAYTPSSGDFIMFSKNQAGNNTSLLGYYAEVKLSNDSTEKAELFALGSEVVQSSK